MNQKKIQIIKLLIMLANKKKKLKIRLLMYHI